MNDIRIISEKKWTSKKFEKEEIKKIFWCLPVNDLTESRFCFQNSKKKRRNKIRYYARYIYKCCRTILLGVITKLWLQGVILKIQMLEIGLF